MAPSGLRRAPSTGAVTLAPSDRLATSQRKSTEVNGGTTASTSVKTVDGATGLQTMTSRPPNVDAAVRSSRSLVSLWSRTPAHHNNEIRETNHIHDCDCVHVHVQPSASYPGYESSYDMMATTV